MIQTVLTFHPTCPIFSHSHCKVRFHVWKVYHQVKQQLSRIWINQTATAPWGEVRQFSRLLYLIGYLLFGSNFITVIMIQCCLALKNMSDAKPWILHLNSPIRSSIPNLTQFFVSSSCSHNYQKQKKNASNLSLLSEPVIMAKKTRKRIKSLITSIFHYNCFLIFSTNFSTMGVCP